MGTPLALAGWTEFNRQKWGLTPINLSFTKDATDLPKIEALLYVNQKGQIRQPHSCPYTPITFHSTNAKTEQKIMRQWLSIADVFISEMRERGLFNMLILPPGIGDVRPWQWAGYRSTARYTFLFDFPYDPTQMDSSVRNSITRAKKHGYTCHRTRNMADVYQCIKDTESRKNIHNAITEADLELAMALLGEEHYRTYVCYAQDGRPASAQVVLHQPGEHAVALLFGTVTEHLPTGATQLLVHEIFNDLQAAGATGFDFVGANIPSVAAAKAKWGGKLMTYYVIEQPGLRTFVKGVRDRWFPSSPLRAWQRSTAQAQKVAQAQIDVAKT